MAHRKSTNRSHRQQRCLHLESFETRLALSAAQLPTTDFQFDGQILQRWLDEQNASNTVVIAPIAPREISLGNLLTLIGSVEQRPGGAVTIEAVSNWLDRRAVQFNFMMPATDGGYIDLSEPADFGNSGGFGSSGESNQGELFGTPGSPAPPGEIGSLEGTAPNATTPNATTPAPLESSPSGGQGAGESLQAWSSLGRPAVIPIDGPAGNVTDVKYARASDAGGWIALEPILDQTEYGDLDSLRLASPEAGDADEGSSRAALQLDREDALAGEWARAAMFEVIGGDPAESPPAIRPAANRSFHRELNDTSISDYDEPSTTLGAIAIPPQAVAALSASGWFDEMAEWVKTRASSALETLFESEEGDDSGAAGGWRGYAGAGALLVAIALERLTANHREDQHTAEANRNEKLRLRHAEFANRLSTRLRPMDAR